MAAFSVELRPLDAHGRRLVLSGEIDLASADAIIRLGGEALDHPDVSLLAVDVAAVTFIDSTALGTLVRLRNASLERGKNLRLDNVSDRVRRLLELTGLGVVFDTGRPDQPND